MYAVSIRPQATAGQSLPEATTHVVDVLLRSATEGFLECIRISRAADWPETSELLLNGLIDLGARVQRLENSGEPGTALQQLIIGMGELNRSIGNHFAELLESEQRAIFAVREELVDFERELREFIGVLPDSPLGNSARPLSTESSAPDESEQLNHWRMSAETAIRSLNDAREDMLSIAESAPFGSDAVRLTELLEDLARVNERAAAVLARVSALAELATGWNEAHTTWCHDARRYPDTIREHLVRAA